MKAPKILLILLFLAAALSLQAQVDGVDPNLLDQILYLKIDARLLSAEGELLWQMENTAYTISGRTVDVRLEGSNLTAISRLTPYRQENDTVLLVAQGEVWYSPDKQAERKYYSGMTSIPVALGESALFFPLGVQSRENRNAFILEIEITVDLFTRQAQSS